ncbi:hypothetical protein ACOMHN_056578 [Nucella lapillus]
MKQDVKCQPLPPTNGKLLLPSSTSQAQATSLSILSTLPRKNPSPPAIVHFSGTGNFTVHPLNTSLGDPVCPETHFRCPGNGYCLPVYFQV